MMMWLCGWWHLSFMTGATVCIDASMHRGAQDVRGVVGRGGRGGRPCTVHSWSVSLRNGFFGCAGHASRRPSLESSVFTHVDGTGNPMEKLERMETGLVRAFCGTAAARITSVARAGRCVGNH